MNKKLRALLLTVLTMITPFLIGFVAIEYPMIATTFLAVIIALVGYKIYTILLGQE